MSLYQLTASVDAISDPVLVMAFEGWVDAGSAATASAEHIARGGTLVAAFDPDALFDYRARRPALDIAAGRFVDITWPALTVTHVRVGASDLLVMTGHEPDYRWRGFAGSVAELAERLEVKRSVALGAIAWAAPHTRPVQLLATASDPEALLPDDRVSEGPIRVPAAAVTVLDKTLGERGIATVGFWAQVPHYVTNVYAPASIALLERLGRHLDVAFPLGDLAGDAQRERASLDAAIAERPDVQDYVARLEQLYDAGGSQTEQLPTGDEIASEIERFLRGGP